MIPFPYNYVAVVASVGASLWGAFAYGQHTATVKAERDALNERVAMYRSVEILAVKLRESDSALLIEQKRAQVVRVEKVTEYVNKYRTKIVEVPGVIVCVDNSGLLDIIDSANPTIPSVKTTGRSND